MGFFTDLKEDLATAVNELIPEDTEETIRSSEGQEAEAPEETEDEAGKIQVTDDFELDKMLENLDSLGVLQDMQNPETEDADQEADEEAADGKELTKEDAEAVTETEDDTLTEEEAAETEAAETEAAEAEDTEAEDTQAEDTETNTQTMTYNITEDMGDEETMDMHQREAVDETAIITQGMIITGDIISEGSVDIIGTVNGNIDILGKLNITGSIQGNSKASEIYADNAKITGEVVSGGSVKIGQSSVIIGNITAASAVIAGAVKGDIDVKGPVILDTSAIVMGNIKSKSVQINNGAVIEGMCSQCYADVNPTSFFEDLKNNK